MPQLNMLIEKRKQTPFIKKQYRPWDLSGSGEQPRDNSKVETQDTNSSQEAPLNSDALMTNLDQTFSANQITNREHIDNNQTKIRNQSDNRKVTNSNQLENKPVTYRQQKENIQVSNREHTDSIIDNISYNMLIKNLSGIQERIFFYIIELCCRRGESETSFISTLDIAQAANCSYGTAKMSLKRLVDKQLIIRRPGKCARGGYINLAINKEIRASALEAKQEKEILPIMHQQIVKQTGVPGNIIREHFDNITDNTFNPNSSSYNYNKNTTTLPMDWKKINLAPLAELGFTEKHLVDIFETKICSSETVQESIFHFAYGLENNSDKYKTYKDPLNVLIGCLRKGKPWHESSYISPQEKALRDLIERRKAEQERLTILENELLACEFQNWKNHLTSEQKLQVLPKKVIGPEEVYLKAYFSENVWPELKIQLIKG